MLIRRFANTLLPVMLLIGCTSPAPNNVQGAVSAPTAVATQASDDHIVALPMATRAPTLTSVETHSPTATALPTSLPKPTITIQPTNALAATSVPVPTSTPTGSTQAAIGNEILFLRAGVLTAFNVQTHKERTLANNVIDFVATLNGRQIALVRTVEHVTELWTMLRDGTSLTQLTKNGNALIEATPAWSSDGLALVFAASSAPYSHEWSAWSTYCATSQVRLFPTLQQSDIALGTGCDPSFSPDGKRIAYASPPTQTNANAQPSGSKVAANTIHLVNRQGQNGWNFATATGEQSGQNAGQVVYAPAWSADGKQLSYHRFVGMQVEVDINISEIGGSFAGQGTPMNSGAGWLLPARFSPNGQMVAITQNNYGDARGFGGYDNWSVTLLQLAGSREIAMPQGPLQAFGQQIRVVARAQNVAWAPDSTALAVELPPGWNADAATNVPLGVDASTPGEVWLWQPNSGPQQKLVSNVDSASPLLWLPAVQYSDEQND